MKYFWIVSILLVSSLFSEAMASGCGHMNHDQAVKEMAENYFDQMDLNEDNVVDAAEFRDSKVSKMVRSFDALQPDADGLLRRESFISAFIKSHSEPAPEV